MTDEHARRTPREIYVDTVKHSLAVVGYPLILLNVLLVALLFVMLPGLAILVIAPSDLGWVAAQNWFVGAVIAIVLWCIFVVVPIFNIIDERYMKDHD